MRPKSYSCLDEKTAPYIDELLSLEHDSDLNIALDIAKKMGLLISSF